MLYLTTKLHIPYYSSLYSKTHSSRSPSPTTPHYTPLHPTTPHYTPLHLTSVFCGQKLTRRSYDRRLRIVAVKRVRSVVVSDSGVRLGWRLVARLRYFYIAVRISPPLLLLLLLLLTSLVRRCGRRKRLQSCEIAARNGALSPVCGRRRDRCGRRLFLIRRFTRLIAYE